MAALHTHDPLVRVYFINKTGSKIQLGLVTSTNERTNMIKSDYTSKISYLQTN